MLRFSLVLIFVVLLSAAFFAIRAPRAQQPAADPNLLWSIGRTDSTGDEFAPGAANQLAYDTASDTAQAWRERQDSTDQEPRAAYTIRFPLSQPPAAAEFDIEALFFGPAPRTAEITLNGKRGSFQIRPAAAQNIDERSANMITFSRQSLRIPIAGEWLHAGQNEIAITLTGNGGSLHYDSLALRKAAAGPPALEAAVEPTIFFRKPDKEVTELVLRHAAPLGQVAAKLRVAGAAATAEQPDDGFDFGERVIEMEVSAPVSEQPYQLDITAGGKTTHAAGAFRPEKRWRIFAGLKIHNDIGYTDLQPNVEELDTRNADGVIDIISKFPFYKFNFETGWLADNYIHSRQPSRVKQLMSLAARGQVGINSLYLNLMTGLCTGEELYRALYFTKSLQRQYGVPLKFASLTDAPSHTWFLPTLLADAGVPGFALGSNQTRAPLLENGNLNEDSPFWWEGADGSRILAWYARSYLQLYRLVGSNPSVEILRRTVPQFLARYRRPDYPVDSVLLYGLYTDNAAIGGGDAEVLKAWNDAYEFPKIIAATDADYYAYLSQHFAQKLPHFRGDGGAYWEDGVGSTARVTAINRDTQRLLPAAETASTLATAFDPALAYPAERFHDAWKDLLFYDEHTWGAHNSIAQPDRQWVKDQWEHKSAYGWRAHWAAKDLLTRSLNGLVQNISIDGPTLFVFNPDLWPRTDLVEIELEPTRSVIDLATDTPVTLHDIGGGNGYRRFRFTSGPVPGLGYRAYAVRRQPAVVAQEQPRDSWEIESRFYRVTLDPATGAIAHLIDKELNRDLADPQAPYRLNQLLYVSGGERSRILQDLVTLQPAQLEIGAQSGAERVLNTGGRIVVRARAPHVPQIETEISVSDDLKRVDIVNRIRKDEVLAKEAVYFAFPFRVSPPELLYEVQNAFVRPNTDQLPGAGREWFTPQNLVLARDSGVTVAWSTPDAPLVTLTDINRGAWPRQLDVRNGYIFSYVMNNYWFTNYKASQGGDFTFRYHITSARTLDEAALARFDAETRSPLLPYNYYDTGNVRLQQVKHRMPAAGGAFFRIDTDHAQLTAFKPAEDGNGFILRLRETAGQKGVARLTSPVFALASAWRTNGVEDNLTPLTVAGSQVNLPLEPRRFTTVRLKLGVPK